MLLIRLVSKHFKVYERIVQQTKQFIPIPPMVSISEMITKNLYQFSGLAYVLHTYGLALYLLALYTMEINCKNMANEKLSEHIRTQALYFCRFLQSYGLVGLLGYELENKKNRSLLNQSTQDITHYTLATVFFAFTFIIQLIEKPLSMYSLYFLTCVITLIVTLTKNKMDLFGWTEIAYVAGILLKTIQYKIVQKESKTV